MSKKCKLNSQDKTCAKHLHLSHMHRFREWIDLEKAIFLQKICKIIWSKFFIFQNIIFNNLYLQQRKWNRRSINDGMSSHDKVLWFNNGRPSSLHRFFVSGSSMRSTILKSLSHTTSNLRSRPRSIPTIWRWTSSLASNFKRTVTCRQRRTPQTTARLFVRL